MMQMKSQRHWLSCVAIGLAVLVLVGCAEKQTEEPEPVVRPVKTFVVGGISGGELTFPATVEAGEKALLSFRVSGRLIELPIDEGMEVKKDQLIGRLDPQRFPDRHRRGPGELRQGIIRLPAVPTIVREKRDPARRAGTAPLTAGCHQGPS